jgi:hypothetical protein
MEKDDTQQYEEVNTSLNTERISDTVNTILLPARLGEDVKTPANARTSKHRAAATLKIRKIT